MHTLFASMLPSLARNGGLWYWLLRRSGLQTWFQQAPAAAQTGREERVFLLLTLTRPSFRSTDPLAESLAASQPALQASGGEVVYRQAGKALISWPVVATGQPTLAVRTYFQLRDAVHQVVGTPAMSLRGAASLGWVKPQWAGIGRCYQGEVLTRVAGILREGQRLGSDLLISAALHHRLAAKPALCCELHVAFDVAGHRYPATLYQVTAA